MPQDPLTDREIAILRGMIDDHESARMVDRWFAVRWKFIGAIIALLSALAILVASILQLVHYLAGG